MGNVPSLIADYLGVFVVAAAAVYGLTQQAKLATEQNQSQQAHDLDLFQSLSASQSSISSMAANIIAEEIVSRRRPPKYLIAGAIGTLKASAETTATTPVYRKVLAEALARKFSTQGLATSARARTFDWQQVDMSNSYLVEFVGDKADFWRADFSRSNLRGSSFKSAALRSAVLAAADLSHSQFCAANLKKANLEAATLDHADFAEADLAGATWRKRVLLTRVLRGRGTTETLCCRKG
jgi:hypothetical protein